MRRLEGVDAASVRIHFKAAARVALGASCGRAQCGTVIVKDGKTLGTGSNGPALGHDHGRRCDEPINNSIKPKYDKTSCVHAEWRAILDACKRHGKDLAGSTLYFIRVGVNGAFTDAGQPFCTVCSRLTLEAGISSFALWNDDGADIYDAKEYDDLTYQYYSDIA